jgi:hypothetical protein
MINDPYDRAWKKRKGPDYFRNNLIKFKAFMGSWVRTCITTYSTKNKL